MASSIYNRIWYSNWTNNNILYNKGSTDSQFLIDLITRILDIFIAILNFVVVVYIFKKEQEEKNINKKQKNAPIGTPIYKLSSVKAVSSKLNVKFFKINHYIHVQNRHMIQFTIRQSYKHVDSLSLIIAYFNLQFHFFPSSIIFLMGIHHLFDGFAYTNRD